MAKFHCDINISLKVIPGFDTATITLIINYLLLTILTNSLQLN